LRKPSSVKDGGMAAEAAGGTSESTGEVSCIAVQSTIEVLS
jgi:hypothetical protein